MSADRAAQALEELDDAQAAPAPAPSAVVEPPKKGKHGGARPGAGRPRKGEERPRPAPGPSSEEKAAEKAAADEELRKERMRAFYSLNETAIKTALGEMYGAPFDLAAALTDIERIRLSSAVKAERAETAYWCLVTFCPDFTKYLPLIALGTALVADASTAFAIYKEEAKARRAGAVMPTRPGPVPKAGPLEEPVKTAEVERIVTSPGERA